MDPAGPEQGMQFSTDALPERERIPHTKTPAGIAGYLGRSPPRHSSRDPCSTSNDRWLTGGGGAGADPWAGPFAPSSLLYAWISNSLLNFPKNSPLRPNGSGSPLLG